MANKDKYSHLVTQHVKKKIGSNYAHSRPVREKWFMIIILLPEEETMDAAQYFSSRAHSKVIHYIYLTRPT